MGEDLKKEQKKSFEDSFHEEKENKIKIRIYSPILRCPQIGNILFFYCTIVLLVPLRFKGGRSKIQN